MGQSERECPKCMKWCYVRARGENGLKRYLYQLKNEIYHHEKIMEDHERDSKILPWIIGLTLVFLLFAGSIR